MIYIDTNIFVYRATHNSPHHDICEKLMDFAIKNDIETSTSIETIQEAIHFLQRINELENGVKISELILEQIKNLVIVDREIITRYLGLIQKYPKADSRDVLHLACAVIYNIQTIITYDKGFKKFKEAQALTPAEYLALV